MFEMWLIHNRFHENIPFYIVYIQKNNQLLLVPEKVFSYFTYQLLL